MSLRIGIDTGGTFTDLVAFDSVSGRVTFHKIPSTPDDPARAIVQGILEIIESSGARRDSVELLVHGTTVATNAVLQRTGAKVALITTNGFRDVLHIQRQDRPSMYDLRSRRARPLVPRMLRLELNERIRHDGSVQTPLDNVQLEQIIARLENEQIESVAVAFLHSNVNPEHELQVDRTIASRLPGAAVCLSHQFIGEHGEYERFSTCVMNAFVQPVVQRYLARLEEGLAGCGVTASLFVMKSNGGVMSAETAGRQCVETILSGPAGGVVAGAGISWDGRPNHRNLITADMGGTSFDVSVVSEGHIAFARSAEMAGLALGVPMLDIHTVGAGGGSIGWIDAGGSLRVGPRSAGALPGPACYRRGGTEPTVTDANVVLGRLGPDSLLAGGLQVDPEAASRAITDKLAKPLGLSVEQAAEGIVRVVNATMTAAIRKLTVERGHDPREFGLCAFGGAGPMHGAELAAELGITTTLVPIAPGVHSAIGLLSSDLREDRVRTYVKQLDQTTTDELEAIFRNLYMDAIKPLRFATERGDCVQVERKLSLRYLGQRYDLPVQVENEPLQLEQVAQDFHDSHEHLYGFARTDQPIELSSLWVSVEVDVGQWPDAPTSKNRNLSYSDQGTRSVTFSGQAFTTPIYRRDGLDVGTKLKGPAMIEQLDSTTVLWPKQQLEVDHHGQLILGPLESR